MLWHCVVYDILYSYLEATCTKPQLNITKHELCAKFLVYTVIGISNECDTWNNDTIHFALWKENQYIYTYNMNMIIFSGTFGLLKWNAIMMIGLNW